MIEITYADCAAQFIEDQDDASKLSELLESLKSHVDDLNEDQQRMHIAKPFKRLKVDVKHRIETLKEKEERSQDRQKRRAGAFI